VKRFLFDNPATGGCGYLRMDEKVALTWFQDAALERFRLTDEALASLRGVGLGGEALAKLDALKDKSFETPDAFLEEISSVLDGAELERCRDLAIRKARQARPIQLVRGVHVEMFLSPQGVGVLSVALRPGKQSLPISPEEASEFNYRLAQFRRHPLACV